MRDSMDGMDDDNFHFNNPVDYMANHHDPWFLHQYQSCDASGGSCTFEGNVKPRSAFHASRQAAFFAAVHDHCGS
ncbi:MAG TPA: hypothetical protein VF551_03625 [Chthoniobacterales bacterium]